MKKYTYLHGKIVNDQISRYLIYTSCLVSLAFICNLKIKYEVSKWQKVGSLYKTGNLQGISTGYKKL